MARVAAIAAVLLSSEVAAGAEDDVDRLEAERLSLSEVVRASELPERSQRRLALAIVREAKRNGLDPLLIAAVIQVESGYDPFAVSPAGAMGLMQIMPDTGRYWASRLGRRLGRTKKLFDPELNVELGTSYLAHLIGQFGSLERALVAYNAGPGAARRILADPALRKRFYAGYVRKVLAEKRRLSALVRQEEFSTAR